MAALNEMPVPVPARGIAALERDLPIITRGCTVEDLGWCRPDDLTLFIPLWSREGHFYLLRLQFHCYPDWPPSAQFVNPRTGAYVFGEDKIWLPTIQAPHLAVHADYSNTKKQLICNSSTLEFYELRHGLDKPEHIWNSETMNFNHTLSTIRQALRSEHYVGRQS